MAKTYFSTPTERNPMHIDPISGALISGDWERHYDPESHPKDKPASDPKYVKHISCDGARWHVLAWNTKGVTCSQKNCIINKEPSNAN